MGILSKVRGKDKGGDAEASKGLDELSLDSPAGDSSPAEGSTVQGGGSDPTEGMELLDLVQVDEEQPAAEADPEDAEVDDLMDIFSSEEEEDVDLSALTGSLPDVDLRSLLTEATEISNSLRELVGDGKDDAEEE